MSWQADFQKATTSVAFQLTLSKNMVLMLADVELYPPVGSLPNPDSYHVSRQHLIAGGVMHDVWVTTANALKRRGLIEYHPAQGFPYGHVFYTLTPAGAAALQMCRLAGLLPDLSAKPANSEQAA